MKKIIGGFMALSACLTGCNDGTINEDQGTVPDPCLSCEY